MHLGLSARCRDSVDPVAWIVGDVLAARSGRPIKVWHLATRSSQDFLILGQPNTSHYALSGFPLFLLLLSYEVFLSSDVTVPPPNLIFHWVADLLNTYKILKDYRHIVRIIIRLSGLPEESIYKMIIEDTDNFKTQTQLDTYSNHCNATKLTVGSAEFSTVQYPWNINFLTTHSPFGWGLWVFSVCLSVCLSVCAHEYKGNPLFLKAY